MSLKRGRDKRAKAKQSFLVPWSKGVGAQETILNAGMGSWLYRVRNKHIRPKKWALRRQAPLSSLNVTAILFYISLAMTPICLTASTDRPRRSMSGSYGTVAACCVARSGMERSMSNVTCEVAINLVCVDCGSILHWVHEDSPFTDIPVLKVQSCKKCGSNRQPNGTPASIGLATCESCGSTGFHRPGCARWRVEDVS